MGTGGEYNGASYCLDNGCIIWDGTSLGKESYYYLFDHEKNKISIIDEETGNNSLLGYGMARVAGF